MTLKFINLAFMALLVISTSAVKLNYNTAKVKNLELIQ